MNPHYYTLLANYRMVCKLLASSQVSRIPHTCNILTSCLLEIDMLKVKIKESEKLAGIKNWTQGFLAWAATALPLSYDNRTTGQPPALTTLHIFSTECFKHTSSTYSAKRIVGADGCLAVVASGGGTSSSSQMCPRFDSHWLPAVHFPVFTPHKFKAVFVEARSY